MHESPRAIAIKLGISKNSVYRIAKKDLDLNMFHRVKGQKLTESDHQKRVVRCKRMLRFFTRENLKKTFFSDESIFTIEGRYNPNFGKNFRKCLSYEYLITLKKWNDLKYFPKSYEHFSDFVYNMGNIILVVHIWGAD